MGVKKLKRTLVYSEPKHDRSRAKRNCFWGFLSRVNLPYSLCSLGGSEFQAGPAEKPRFTKYVLGKEVNIDLTGALVNVVLGGAET